MNLEIDYCKVTGFGFLLRVIAGLLRTTGLHCYKKIGKPSKYIDDLSSNSGIVWIGVRP